MQKIAHGSPRRSLRGYTFGALADLHGRVWSLRFLEALMPKIANGIDLQWNLRRARAHNLELELRPHLLLKHSTRVRLLAYRNVADMGSYRQAISDFLATERRLPTLKPLAVPAERKMVLD